MPAPKMTSELDESLDKSNIKCVLVGDSAIGKSCLAARITNNTFHTEYLPTLFDNYAVTVIVQNEPYVLSLFDTPGQDEYIRLRTMSYMKCDVFAVCFSVVKRESYKHVSDIWLPEIRRYLPNTPFLLVGTQTDLRQSGVTTGGGVNGSNNNPLKPVVSSAEGVKMADRLGAHCYVECSALNQTGIQTVKHKLIRAAQDIGQGKGGIVGDDDLSDSCTKCGCQIV
ncbi:cdc42 homolog isoform X2 [Octopus vulgaris]|uniref:Cdc42 homolog isoform X2 n=2 Tax=Octopus vulgaris TaxID=6645 RepID=A0AA36FP48_OCTVU|nr:cdc42 homolog isoform X2 [Octopus vulgaris]